MARFLDVDGFADGIAALQTEIRGDRRIPSIVADGFCATLGGVLRQVRAEVMRAEVVRAEVMQPDTRRVDPGLDEAARQASLMGGADRHGLRLRDGFC